MGRRVVLLGAIIYLTPRVLTKSSSSQHREDIMLRSDIERKRLLVKARAQGRDERERDYAEDRAAEEPSPLAASIARSDETGKAACDHQEVPRGTNQDQQQDRS